MLVRKEQKVRKKIEYKRVLGSRDVFCGSVCSSVTFVRLCEEKNGAKFSILCCDAGEEAMKTMQIR